jgi:hypothetical protein
MSHTKLTALALAFALAAPGAFAQGTAPATTPMAPAASGKAGGMMTPDAKKAKSAECSKEADAKKLHGKERKKFREECKKGA